jgi:hypothetical protein
MPASAQAPLEVPMPEAMSREKLAPRCAAQQLGTLLKIAAEVPG